MYLENLKEKSERLFFKHLKKQWPKITKFDEKFKQTDKGSTPKLKHKKHEKS